MMGVQLAVPQEWWDAINATIQELGRAMEKHPAPFHSPHEGYAILLEEVDELWTEIKAQKRNDVLVRREAVHTAAMALRFLIDLPRA